jgi:hypothetical protein
MSAAAAVVPDKGFGLVALTNVNSCRLPQALVYHALDSIVLERESRWLDVFHERERFGRERLDYAEEDRKRSTVAGTKPSRPLEAYAGTYEDAFYGTATVTHRDGGLRLSFIGFDGPLEHWQFDSFTVAIDDPYLRTHKSTVRFELDDFGEPSELTLVVLGALRMKLARKQPDPAAIELSAEKVVQCTGRYVCVPASLEVAIDLLGNALKITIPGTVAGSAEDYVVRSLVPVAGNRFAISGTRATLRFESGDTALLEVPHQMPITLTRRKSAACQSEP